MSPFLEFKRDSQLCVTSQLPQISKQGTKPSYPSHLNPKPLPQIGEQGTKPSYPSHLPKKRLRHDLVNQVRLNANLNGVF